MSTLYPHEPAHPLAGSRRAHCAHCGAPAPTRADLARVRLQALCSRYGWSLWGFIQAAASPLDFDFWSWGLERYELARKAFADPGFPQLLEEVVGA